MSRARPVGTDVEDIHDRVYALNESVQKQLEEVDKRYMELHEWDEKKKGAMDATHAIHGAKDDDDVQLLWTDAEWWFIIQCTVSTTSTTSASSSTISTFSTRPPRDLEGISNTNNDQYSKFLGFFLILEFYIDNLYFICSFINSSLI